MIATKLTRPVRAVQTTDVARFQIAGLDSVREAGRESTDGPRSR